jgi:hypothetical protein
MKFKLLAIKYLLHNAQNGTNSIMRNNGLLISENNLKLTTKEKQNHFISVGGAWMIPFYSNSLMLFTLNTGKMYSTSELKLSSDTKYPHRIFK